MLLATFKHISSKNADYSAAEAYLTFEHDEFTMKPTLDENGRLIPRQNYRISTLNCGDEDFAIACLRANLRYGKNQKREDVKSHHYIISFDPKDVSDHGLNVDLAQSLGEKFCKEHFPGHQAIVCTHPDGHNGSGNVHVHIVIIIILNAAKRYFDSKGLKKLPSYKALQTEVEQLIKEKNELYNQYQTAKEEAQRLDTIRHNLEQTLGRKIEHKKEQER